MKPKPVFLTRLDTVKAVDLKSPFERLREPLRYYSNLAAGVLEVPRGFPTDFASCRVGDLHLRGKTDRPAVLHDWLYASADRNKFVSDILFYEACRSEGLGRIRSGLRCAAVLVLPAAHRAWKAHRQGKTHGARFFAALRGHQETVSITNQP